MPPAYSKVQRVIDYITQKVDSGEWPAGHQLPSDRQLREHLEVSQMTIRFAMERLADRIESQQGVGRFVKE
jgi:DNA-binding GntR family transcriptional regulator